jgi:hypothetical protein
MDSVHLSNTCHEKLKKLYQILSSKKGADFNTERLAAPQEEG